MTSEGILIVEAPEIGRVNLKNPGDLGQDTEILEESKRLQYSHLLVRKIEAFKTKLNNKWKFMTPEQYQLLKKLRKLNSFECTYYDDDTGDYGKGKYYCGPVKAAKKRFNREGTRVLLYIDITANFVEF